MSKYLLFFSGGLDSTGTAIRLLNEGHEVTGLYVTIENNGQKVSRERSAIRKLLKLPPFNNGKFDFTESASVYLHFRHSNMLMPQFPMFLMTMIYHMRSEYDYIALAYVKGDDNIDLIPFMLETYQSLAWLSQSTAPKLVFPMVGMTKREIWFAMPEEIRNTITWCEAGRYKAREKTRDEGCGICDPCIRMQQEGLWTGSETHETITARLRA